jgi:hypothetical protein
VLATERFPVSVSIHLPAHVLNRNTLPGVSAEKAVALREHAGGMNPPQLDDKRESSRPQSLLPVS